MALTDSQTAFFDRKLGRGTWTTDDIEPRLVRNGYDLTATVREVIEGRLAALRAQPATFAVPGEYSQSTAANIASYETILADLGTSDAGGGISVGRIMRPSLRQRTFYNVDCS